MKYLLLLSILLSNIFVYGASFEVSCANPPSHLSSIQRDTNHVTIAWIDNNTPAETLWDIGYKISGSNTWSEIVATTNPYQVPNLQSGTTYEFRVRSNCGSTKSGWSINNILATTDINNGEGCNLNLPIPDNNCPIGIDFGINISSADSDAILGDDVKLREVNIIIDHIWEQDLTLKLIAPNGSSVILAANLGGANIEGYGTNNGFCDEYTSFTENVCDANFYISDHSLLSFNGSFFPENSFNNLDGSVANGLWHLEICDDSPDHVGKLVFVELVLSPFNCSAPTNLVISEELETSITVNWDPVIAGEQARISVVEKGFPLSSGSLFFTNDNVFVIPNLQLNTEYEIYVQRQCIGSRYSDPSCTVYGQTKCNTSIPTIIEDFNNEIVCNSICGDHCNLVGFWQNSDNDELDWMVNEGSTPTAFTGPSDDVTIGGKYLFLESSNIACNNGEGILTSHCTTIDAPFSDCHLGFSYFMYGLEVNSLKIEINDFSGNGWTVIWQKNGSQYNQWLRDYIDLSAYHGLNVQFRIVGKTGVNGNSDIAIDQFEFYGSQDNGMGVFSYFRDQDGDSFGDENEVIYSCSSTAPNGYITVGGDCDDLDPMINPNGIEILCNQIDENCNGMADDSDIELLEFVEEDINICFGESVELKVSSQPQGKVEWFDAPVNGNLLSTGLVYNTGSLNRKRSYYVQDAVEIGSGLKITQILVNFSDSGVEIQNIDQAKDYTGWKIYVNDNRLDINDYLPIPWELGPMAVKEVQTRTKSTWGGDFKWLSGAGFKGWVLLLDNQNIVQDVLFWNWNSNEIQTFNVNINGANFTVNDLPWNGNGFNLGACSYPENTNIFLKGNNETDSEADYECGVSNFGAPNPNLDYYYTCISGRSKIDVNVSTVILDEYVERNNCEAGGNIEIVATNGIEPYVYSWSNGAADTNHLVNVLPDTYIVTVTDAIGCSAVSNSFNLTDFTETFAIDILKVEQISCNESDDGTIVMEVIDGQAPYQFNWTGGFERDLENAVDSIGSLEVGNYILTVTDNNGCIVSSEEIVIVEPLPMMLSIDIVNVKCAGSPEGEINTNVNGGTQPYKYKWSNDKETENIDELKAGKYILTVTDAHDCTVGIESEIFEPKEKLTASVNKIKNVTCYGYNDGLIEVSPKGGVAGYKYQWAGGQKEARISNLKGGDYNVTISDGNDCNFVFENSIKVLESSSPLSINPIVQNEKCDGLEDGEIILNTSGGMPPYDYVWSEKNNRADTLSDLSDGIYVCSITDNFGCPKVTEKIKVLVNDYDLAIDSSKIFNILCNDADDGVIELFLSGGKTPYIVSWDNESTGEMIENLETGIYSATISDNLGCQIQTGNYFVSQPDPLKIDTVYTNQINQDGNNGIATVIVSGGVWPYTYQWNDPNNQTTQTAIGLKKGTYEVTITDSNGCEIVESCSIVVTSLSDIGDSEQILVFPNPTNALVTIQYSGLNKFQITTFSSVGKELTIPFQQIKPNLWTFDFSNYSEGMYYVVLIAENGRNIRRKIVVVR